MQPRRSEPGPPSQRALSVSDGRVVESEVLIGSSHEAGAQPIAIPDCRSMGPAISPLRGLLHYRRFAAFLAAAAGFLWRGMPWGWPIPSASARSMSFTSCFFTGFGGLALFAAGFVGSAAGATASIFERAGCRASFGGCFLAGVLLEGLGISQAYLVRHGLAIAARASPERRRRSAPIFCSAYFVLSGQANPAALTCCVGAARRSEIGTRAQFRKLGAAAARVESETRCGAGARARLALTMPVVSLTSRSRACDFKPTRAVRRSKFTGSPVFRR